MRNPRARTRSRSSSPSAVSPTPFAWRRQPDSTGGSSMATTTSPIGRGTPRVDGPAKVSGTAKYTSDFHFPGMLYAVPVGATIANGEIKSLKTSAAEKMPGVRAIYHRKNIGKLFRIVEGEHFDEGISDLDETRPPF